MFKKPIIREFDNIEENNHKDTGLIEINIWDSEDLANYMISPIRNLQCIGDIYCKNTVSRVNYECKRPW